MVQGVQQNTFHFCFLNFSASYCSRNSILDIFQQPFPYRFWKYPFFYRLVKPGLSYFQNTTEMSFQKLTFFVYYWIKHLNTLDHSGAFMSAQEHLWELRSIQETSWALMKMVPCYHEYSWVFLSAHKPCSWEHMSSYESSWVLMALWHHSQEYSWLVMAAHGCLCLIMSDWECSQLLISTHDSSWALMSRHDNPWALMGNGHGHGAMVAREIMSTHWP